MTYTVIMKWGGFIGINYLISRFLLFNVKLFFSSITFFIGDTVCHLEPVIMVCLYNFICGV